MSHDSIDDSTNPLEADHRGQAAWDTPPEGAPGSSRSNPIIRPASPNLSSFFSTTTRIGGPTPPRVIPVKDSSPEEAPDSPSASNNADLGDNNHGPGKGTW